MPSWNLRVRQLGQVTVTSFTNGREPMPSDREEPSVALSNCSRKDLSGTRLDSPEL